MALFGILTKCGLLSAVLVAIVAFGVQLILKQAGMSEFAVRKLVELARIPPSLYDHIQVMDESVWYDIITKGNLGIAEGYMHGKLNVDPMPFFTTLLNGTTLGTRRKEGSDILGQVLALTSLPTSVISSLSNQQTKALSTRVANIHYDAGNNLYEAMLGPSMAYSCAYWQNATNLDQAQINKFDLIRRKLELTPGMKVLDIGMGWGTAASHIHEHGKADVTGISLSKQQVKWAQDNLQKTGLKYMLQDYRDHCADPAAVGTYDRIYSIGMFEHVGYQNFGVFFKCVKRLLKPDGLAVLHTIGELDFLPAGDDFLDKYIFPGFVIPALSSVVPAFQDDFVLEDFQNFGHDYARTLNAWSVRSKQFFDKNPGAYSVEFMRMWNYYLKMCEALFELRMNQLWHFVLSPRPATRQRIDRQV